MGARKNWVRKGDTRVSLARPVLSCAHYFQAPATWREMSQSKGAERIQPTYGVNAAIWARGTRGEFSQHCAPIASQGNT